MILVVLKKLFIVKCVCNVRINFNAFFSFIEVGCSSKPNFGFPFFFLCNRYGACYCHIKCQVCFKDGILTIKMVTIPNH